MIGMFIRYSGWLQAILLVSFSVASFQVNSQSSPLPGYPYDIALSKLLNEEGYVQLPEGFSGSIDSSGFEMITDQDGGLRFLQSVVNENDQWSQGEFGFPGCTGAVYSMLSLSGELYIGGDFQACGFAAASNIARFDPKTGEYSALGDGVNGTVFELTVIGTDLYVGGTFSQAGSEGASNIARFDTTQSGNEGWSALGDGVSNYVGGLAPIGTVLYVGGDFGLAGGFSARRVARYDTTKPGNAGWSALGDGVNGIVRALAVVGSELYVGGFFSEAGGQESFGIASFDTIQSGNEGWSTLGEGVFSTNALIAVGTDLYVGGNFSQIGGEPFNNIARYDTTNPGSSGWSALGEGVNNDVWAFSLIGTDLFVGGFFGEAGGNSARNVVRYDTTQSGNSGWSGLGDGVFSGVFSVASIDTDLFVGGRFNEAGGVISKKIARYDTTQSGNSGWSSMGNGINESVLALAAIGPELCMGGSFLQVGTFPANRIACYDTTQTGSSGWRALGEGVNRNVNSLVAIGSVLYVGGEFSTAGKIGASRIARYDTSKSGNDGWSTLGDGVNNIIETLTVIGTELFVGGWFTQAGDSGANFIARYDTSKSDNSGWAELGNGVDDRVYALASIGTDLYVGGDFGIAGSLSASRIASFDSTQFDNEGWSTLGDGITGAVYTIDAVGTDLFVGGSFNQAGSLTVSSIARYDTTKSGNAGWIALGDGVDFYVEALAAIGTDLYVGGQFFQAGSAVANNLARYDISQTGNAGWSALGEGLNSSVLTLFAIETDLYAGGFFSLAGGKANGYIARYDSDIDALYKDGFE